MAVIGTNVLTPLGGARDKIRAFSWAWTSDSSGDVSGVLTSANITGKPQRLVTIPDGTDAPTDDYDITILDDNGVDILATQGANRDTANTERVQSLAATPFDYFIGTLELVVANAGNAKKGVAILYYE